MQPEQTPPSRAPEFFLLCASLCLLGVSMFRLHTFALVSDPAFYLLEARRILETGNLFGPRGIAPLLPMLLAGLMVVSVPLAYLCNGFVMALWLGFIHRMGRSIAGHRAGGMLGVLLTLGLIWPRHPEFAAYLLYPFREPLATLLVWLGVALAWPSDRSTGSRARATGAAACLLLAVGVRETVIVFAGAVWITYAFRQEWKSLVAFSLVWVAAALTVWLGYRPAQAMIYAEALGSSIQNVLQGVPGALTLFKRSMAMWVHPAWGLGMLGVVGLIRWRRDPRVLALLIGAIAYTLELAWIRPHARYLLAGALFWIPLAGWGWFAIASRLRLCRWTRLRTTRAAMLGITLALTPAFLAAWKLEPWGPKAGFVTVKQFKQVASALPERSIVIDDTDLPLQCLVGSFKIWPPYRPTVGKMDSFYVLEPVEGKDLASGSTAPAPSRFAQIRDRFDMRPVPGAPELKLAERRWGLLLAEPFHTRTVDLPIAPTATWLWVDLADSHHPQGLSLMWTTGSGKVLAHAPFARSPGWVGFQVPPDTRGLQLESENPMPSSPRTVEVSPDSPIRFPFESSRTPSDARLIPNPSGKGSVPYLIEFRDQATLRLPQIGHATGPSRWKGRVILRAAEKRTPGRIRVTSGEEEISSQTTYLPALSSGWKTWACEFVVGVEGPDEAPRAREVTLHQEPSELLLRLLEWEWTPITGP